jgi:predicted GIY-YIG superfamily endonuclease
VVLLDPEAARDPAILRHNPKRDPTKPCVYVGLTGLLPEQRFKNHKQGIKASQAVQRYGLRLLPELYECFNPMPFEAAVAMERELAQDLRQQGFTVAGGT